MLIASIAGVLVNAVILKSEVFLEPMKVCAFKIKKVSRVSNAFKFIPEPGKSARPLESVKAEMLISLASMFELLNNDILR